ncbi:hypothetical protein L21SP4_01484 [Kiritimatiella glycovorans]|uniref:Uncharacterized protein n=1 Tax=Kiritimatiella glycovorans TaxID=1307763 RepID=A0A0G3EKM3_9BACT|nr:hypothetical protein L21SP4_01484 [Kiritimatiella glycovorans]
MYSTPPKPCSIIDSHNRPWLYWKDDFDPDEETPGQIEYRHDGHANMCFYDEHVEELTEY